MVYVDYKKIKLIRKKHLVDIIRKNEPFVRRKQYDTKNKLTPIRKKCICGNTEVWYSISNARAVFPDYAHLIV